MSTWRMCQGLWGYCSYHGTTFIGVSPCLVPVVSPCAEVYRHSEQSVFYPICLWGRHTTVYIQQEANNLYTLTVKRLMSELET